MEVIAFLVDLSAIVLASESVDTTLFVRLLPENRWK